MSSRIWIATVVRCFGLGPAYGQATDCPDGPATKEVTGRQVLARMPVTRSPAQGRFPEQYFHN